MPNFRVNHDDLVDVDDWEPTDGAVIADSSLDVSDVLDSTFEIIPPFGFTGGPIGVADGVTGVGDTGTGGAADAGGEGATGCGFS